MKKSEITQTKILEILLTATIICFEMLPDMVKEIESGMFDETLKGKNGGYDLARGAFLRELDRVIAGTTDANDRDEILSYSHKLFKNNLWLGPMFADLLKPKSQSR